MKTKAIVVGLASLAAAALTFAKTGGQVFARSQPQLALTIDPANPDAKARLASVLVAKADPDATALDRARALSLQVLRTTPGDSTALRTLGMAEVGRDPERGVALVEAATRFSKRDTAAQLWLVDYYGTRGQDDRALVSLGSALRTSVSSRPLLFPALLQTIGQPAFVPQLVGLLAPQTEWSDAFWDYAAGAEALPNGTAGVIVAVRRAGGTLPRDPARDIVGKLASAGDIAGALAVLSAVEPQADVRGAFAGVQDFESQRLPMPFSWEVVSTGRLYGQPGAAGELRTDVRPGSQGLIARRLITLPIGRTTLTGTLAVTSGPPSDAPVLTVRCAGGGAPLTMVKPDTPTTAIRAAFAVPAGCPHQWIEIISPEVRAGGGSATTVSNLTLASGAGR